MDKKAINEKTTALLALEAKMIEKNTDVYNLENYIPEMFSQIEEVISSDHPERLLDSTELKTFQTLIYEHTGGERRQGDERRKISSEEAAAQNRRSGDRRWYGIDNVKK